MDSFDYDIVVSIVSGIISGLIVAFITWIIEKRMLKKESFQHDQQTCSRYLELLKLEIDFAFKSNNTEELQKVIEGRPVMYGFEHRSLKHLRDTSFNNTLNKMGKMLDDISEKIEGGTFFSENKEKIKGALNQIKLSVLRTKY